MQAPVLHIQIDDNDIPRTIDKRVKVNMIAVKHIYGVSADEIANHYGIDLAHIYATLAYYYDNQSHMEAFPRKRETNTRSWYRWQRTPSKSSGTFSRETLKRLIIL